MIRTAVSVADVNWSSIHVLEGWRRDSSGGGEEKRKRKEFTESTPGSITIRLHRVGASRKLRGEGDGRRVGGPLCTKSCKIRGQQSAPLKW